MTMESIKQSQGEAAFSSHLRRDAASVHWQETLNALHRQAKVSEDDLARSSFKIAELEILLADHKLLRRDIASVHWQETLNALHRQAKVSEDDLARSSFKIAELEILLADYKLRADDAKVRHERELYQSRADLVTAMCELHEEKKRCAQKNMKITDLKEQVAALKAGGDCFDSQEAVEAQELSEFRIAELEILLEEQRDDNTMLRAKLLSEEDKSLTAEMLLSSSSTQEQEMGNSGGLGQSVLRKAGKTLSLIDKLRRSSVPRKHEKVLFKIGKKFLGLLVATGSKMFLQKNK
ncbi:Hypp2139 [Branchiostoma lanceolatum]|uniref:Hypp2139 protein n=1 Tax=Branchiostoma lanceolatum TaxID=7740 RepID=A0A8K0ERM1_BRALA|nr:Hypp2139 [Branchiostoma lanceolatum]